MSTMSENPRFTATDHEMVVMGEEKVVQFVHFSDPDGRGEGIPRGALTEVNINGKHLPQSVLDQLGDDPVVAKRILASMKF